MGQFDILCGVQCGGIKSEGGEKNWRLVCTGESVKIMTYVASQDPWKP